MRIAFSEKTVWKGVLLSVSLRWRMTMTS